MQAMKNHPIPEISLQFMGDEVNKFGDPMYVFMDVLYMSGTLHMFILPPHIFTNQYPDLWK